MPETLYKIKRDIGLKLRDWLERWRALPRERQWTIGGSLFGVSTLILIGVAWLVFSRPSATHTLAQETSVTLYTSVDADVLGPILDGFTAATGIKVESVTDTEATKTTGLVQRLLAEKLKPRADVWWSSEPMGTITLAENGLLDPYVSREEATLKTGWPKELRAADRSWYGFAQRARIIAYNSNRLNKSTAPTRLRDLTAERFRNKVGMARPQFGTTRTHIAVLIALHGEEAVRQFLTALNDNGLRLYDGNSGVVHALSVGEIEAGLTDTDDAWAAQRENWPVEVSYEVVDKPGAKVTGLPSVGPLVIPNTVARLKGSPHPSEGKKLIDYLLSADVEAKLAGSDSHNIPVRPEVAKQFNMTAVPNPAQVDPVQVAAALPKADRLINELFPLR